MAHPNRTLLFVVAALVVLNVGALGWYLYGTGHGHFGLQAGEIEDVGYVGHAQGTREIRHFVAMETQSSEAIDSVVRWLNGASRCREPEGGRYVGDITVRRKNGGTEYFTFVGPCTAQDIEGEYWEVSTPLQVVLALPGWEIIVQRSDPPYPR